jgi:Fe-S cluster biosynthesis and repair protein YggX
VQRIFSLYNGENLTLQEIADLLNKQSVAIPSASSKKKYTAWTRRQGVVLNDGAADIEKPDIHRQYLPHWKAMEKIFTTDFHEQKVGCYSTMLCIIVI